MDRNTVLTGWDADRSVSYLEAVALSDGPFCDYPDWSLCDFHSLDTLLG